MTPLRVAILGPGAIAARHAAAVAAMRDEAQLVAVCGRDPAKAQVFAAEHGGKAYENRDRMLDEAAPDILIIALPPFAHTDEVAAAAGRGVHMLIEKPIALDNSQADAMVAASEGVKTQVGFMYRYGAAVRSWEASSPGRVGLFAGRFHSHALHAPWWRERALSGGQMVEQAIHMIDLVRVHMGEPQTVYARTANLFHKTVPRYTSEDVSAIVFGFDDGRIATLNATNAAVPGTWAKEWHLVAERAAGHFTDWNTGTITHTIGPVRSEAVAGTEDVFEAQLRDLVAAIREDRPARVPMSEGAASLRLALAARRSADERREILV